MIHPVLRIAFLLMIGVVARTPSANAQEGGEMRFQPESPRPGQAVEVAYRPGTMLAHEERLVLRARLRTPNDQDAYVGAIGAETGRVAEMARGADGWYRGTVRMADSVVLAVLAVESVDGERVDTHGQRGWELLMHGADGRPLAKALDQLARDLTERDATRGLATARERLRLYPDDPEGLGILRFFEGYVLGRDSAVAMDGIHRPEFTAMARALDARARVTGEQAGALARLARGMDDSAAAAHWTERLLRDDPLHPYAVEARAGAIMRAGTPAERLAALEALWNEAGPAHDYLLQMGLRASLMARDADAARRWTERIERHIPVARGMLAQTFAEMPPLRAEAVRLLRARLDELLAARDGDRDLFRTVSLQRDLDDEQAATLLVALAQAHLADGERDAALHALAEAGARGWEPARLRAAAGMQLTAGDTTGAVWALARVAADPGAPPAFADSAAVLLGRHFDAAAWARQVTDARTALRARVVRARVDRALPADLRVTDVAGGSVALGERFAAAPATVVFFWRSTCPYSRQALPQVRALVERGIPVVAITDQEASPELGAYLERERFAAPVLIDTRRASHAAFGSSATPQFFVVDANGRVRFEFSALGELPRQVAAVAEP
ncbi:redoxin domain-containing protein [Longimicrobium sp.]|uniref:redoxin domain-containing protein n=1 Tax=Longimicrobium sp. TaxID=2029185 RepID=UPI002E304443|nr:redoxin domain-containing protein [Longimicrobium sp.]HEX6041842.1 redoxin domain-containing protein [Longimicrobium sp.]